MKKTFEGMATDVDVEDGGCAKIVYLDESEGSEEGMFICLKSWTENGIHTDLDKFIGKKIRVTVEVVE